ncbi:MAG: hypothetical protein AB7I36_08280 [Rhodospirillaceae bacterium]
MSAFTDMAHTLFNDPNFATTGTYTPAGGAAAEVRVLKAPPSVSDLSMQQGRAGRLPTKRPRLLVSEVATKPPKDSTLTFEGSTYIIESAVLVAQETEWQLDVRKQS